MADSNKIIGYRIATARGNADESQATLAAALGVQREMVTYWENGTRPIKVEKIIEIAKRYSISTDFLLGLSDHPTVSEDMKTAIKVTGLSEKAIENARQLVDQGNGNEYGKWSILSKLMETDGFLELIYDIEELYENVKTLEDEYSHINNWTLPVVLDSEGNPLNQAITSHIDPYQTQIIISRLYDFVRLAKYDLRDSFAALLETMIPTAEVLSSVKALLREGVLSVLSEYQGGNENDRE